MPKYDTKAGECLIGQDAVAFLQGELPPNRASEFERHCGTCASCRRDVDELRSVVSRLRAEKAPERTRDLASAVLADIPEGEWKHASSGVRLYAFLPQFARIAAVFVILIAAGAVLFTIMHRRGDTAKALADKSGVKPPAGVNVAPTKSEAVVSGLSWLAANQEPDGSWNAAKWGAMEEHTVGVTALSLLAFIGGDANKYASSIGKGAGYLVSRQDVSGRFGPVCDNAMYNHGMATMALLKAAALKPDPALQAACNKAIGFIRGSQKQSGGWGYGRTGAEEANTSVAIWQIQSLMLAQQMGQTGLDPAIARSLAWLRGMVDGGGVMGYSRDPAPAEGNADTLTAAGILCLFAGRKDSGGDERLDRMVRSLESAVAKQGRTLDYYRWYFLTHALRSEAGGESRKLLVELQDSLVARQTRGGSGAGSWELGDQWSPAGGRIYATSMAILSLE